MKRYAMVGIVAVLLFTYAATFVPGADAKTLAPGEDCIVPDVGIELVWIEPGTFMMGRSEPPLARMIVSEVPAVKVTLTRGYWIGKYPLTRAEYDIIMDGRTDVTGDDARRPATMDWDSALGCTIELTDRARTEGWLPEGYQFRLPTEAEWEYAARAGREGDYYFTDEPMDVLKPPDGLDDHVWHRGNSGGETQPVGLKKPNPWGLHDVYGNVWEWCLDRSETYYHRLYPDGTAEDPLGMEQRDRWRYYIKRGGSVQNSAINTRSSVRSEREGGGPTGFRIVLAPELDLTYFHPGLADEDGEENQ